MFVFVWCFPRLPLRKTGTRLTFFFKHVCFLSITPNKEVREFELDTNIPLRYRVTLMEAFLVS